MKTFSGKACFLDRSDINTDEIIPAKYLTEPTREALRPYLLEDLCIDGFDPKEDLENVGVIVARDNFGCGSSREHAAWAFEINGIHLVVAASFARIFERNMYNRGMMALTLPSDTIDDLFHNYAHRQTNVRVDLEAQIVAFEADGRRESIPVSISEFDLALVKAGGWVEYADKNY